MEDWEIEQYDRDMHSTGRAPMGEEHPQDMEARLEAEIQRLEGIIARNKDKYLRLQGAYRALKDSSAGNNNLGSTFDFLNTMLKGKGAK